MIRASLEAMRFLDRPTSTECSPFCRNFAVRSTVGATVFPSSQTEGARAPTAIRSGYSTDGRKLTDTVRHGAVLQANRPWALPT
jgi:hypothetical protein